MTTSERISRTSDALFANTDAPTSGASNVEENAHGRDQVSHVRCCFCFAESVLRAFAQSKRAHSEEEEGTEGETERGKSTPKQALAVCLDVMKVAVWDEILICVFVFPQYP